jgi:prepilin-type N-terminal cleavage/methylation domain-containing protein
MNQKSGFTLLEIMIVVAVIAILALALLPNLLGSRRSVQDSAIETTLQRAMTAQELFHARCGYYYRTGVTGNTRCATADAPGEWGRIYQDTDPNVTLAIHSSTATNTYCIAATHSAEPTRSWRVNGGTAVTNARPAPGACS